LALDVAEDVNTIVVSVRPDIAAQLEVAGEALNVEGEISTRNVARLPDVLGSKSDSLLPHVRADQPIRPFLT
jgi:hypothetical protein